MRTHAPWITSRAGGSFAPVRPRAGVKQKMPLRLRGTQAAARPTDRARRVAAAEKTRHGRVAASARPTQSA